jgi:hypothetical protein
MLRMARYLPATIPDRGDVSPVPNTLTVLTNQQSTIVAP